MLRCFPDADLLDIPDSCCFFAQKTAYEMRISDWSSDWCSSDLLDLVYMEGAAAGTVAHQCIDCLGRKVFDQFPNPGRSGALAAIDCQKGFGQGDGDLAGLEAYDCAIASNNMEVFPLAGAIGRGGRRRATGGGARKCGVEGKSVTGGV